MLGLGVERLLSEGGMAVLWNCRYVSAMWLTWRWAWVGRNKVGGGLNTGDGGTRVGSGTWRVAVCSALCWDGSVAEGDSALSSMDARGETGDGLVARATG